MATIEQQIAAIRKAKDEAEITPPQVAQVLEDIYEVAKGSGVSKEDLEKIEREIQAIKEQLNTSTLIEQQVFEYSNSDNVPVEHNSNRYPNVVVTDVEKNILVADVEFVSANKLIVRMDAKASGYIIIN